MKPNPMQFIHQDGLIAMHVTVAPHGSSGLYRVSHSNTMREIPLTVETFDTVDEAMLRGINLRLDCYNDIVETLRGKPEPGQSKKVNDLDMFTTAQIKNVCDALIENNQAKSEGDARSMMRVMSRYEIVNRYLMWEGIMGYTDQIIGIVDNSLKAQG